MAESKARSRRIFSGDKMVRRINSQLELSEHAFKEFNKKSNYGELLSELVESYYDENTVILKIDDKIKEAFHNDPFKEFRIPMLLIEYYLNNGNISKPSAFEINNRQPLQENNKNIMEEDKEKVSVNIEKDSIPNKTLNEEIVEIEEEATTQNEHVEETVEKVNDKIIEDDIKSTKEEQLNKNNIASDHINKAVEEKKQKKINTNMSGNLKDLIPSSSKSLL